MTPRRDSCTHAPDAQGMFYLRHVPEAQVLESVSAPGLPGGCGMKMHPLTCSMQRIAPALHPAQIEQREFVDETIKRLALRASKRLQLADEIGGFEFIQDGGHVTAA